jgi:outer membrane protein assembly factor BamC
MVDPSRGLMESSWIIARGDTADEIFESMNSGMTWADQGANKRYKFRVRVEPGIRTGSTEVYLEQKSLPIGAPVRVDALQWTGVSDSPELEGVVLSKMAYYLGDRINESTSVSRLASNIGGQKAELIPDRTMPVLKYKLPFNRAWATVGDALENARISVEDLNRDNAIYYVFYRDDEAETSGFFGRLFSGKDKEKGDVKVEAGDAHRYQVLLSDKGDEVHVTVKKDEANLANALIAEKLLKIIKQFST